MKQKLRKGLQICLLLIFAFSFGMFIYYSVQSSNGNDIYIDAQELAKSAAGASETEVEEPEDTSDGWKELPVEDEFMKTFETKNLDVLRTINEDVIGWITIPDTPISYPIMKGEDNEYYLKTTWNRESNFVGSIFLECMNSPDFTDFNTIVYGHNMFDDTMFGSLNEYKNLDYWKEHPYVYTYDDRGCHRYEVFAAYVADVESDTYRLGFSKDEAKTDFIQYCLSESEIDTGIIPTVNDKILTLSTCTNYGYSTRWVVQARLRGMSE